MRAVACLYSFRTGDLAGYCATDVRAHTPSTAKSYSEARVGRDIPPIDGFLLTIRYPFQATIPFFRWNTDPLLRWLRDIQEIPGLLLLRLLGMRAGVHVYVDCPIPTQRPAARDLIPTVLVGETMHDIAEPHTIITWRCGATILLKVDARLAYIPDEVAQGAILHKLVLGHTLPIARNETRIPKHLGHDPALPLACLPACAPAYT